MAARSAGMEQESLSLEMKASGLLAFLDSFDRVASIAFDILEKGF